MGIEPTDAFKDAALKGHHLYHGFLSEELAQRIIQDQGTFDFITFTNVFAHIENLQEVLNSLKILMNENTVIVIENHYLGAILEKNQFDTFYHEHPRTYSYTSFVYIARSLGLTVLDVEFPARYGGNIRVFLGNNVSKQAASTKEIVTVLEKEQGFIHVFAELCHKIDYWKNNKQIFFQHYLNNNLHLRAKAFPGRSAILIKLLGIDEQIISAVYEKPGSLKIGHYVPGTRIPILSDDELFNDVEHNAMPILNLAWHIPNEIRTYMKEKGYRGAIIDILHQQDFILEDANV